MNKTTDVLNHLMQKGSITQNEAYNLYGVTRLTDTIYHLKQKNCPIISEKVQFKDRYGRTGYYVKYHYLNNN